MDVKRTGIVLKPNNSRVLFRPFQPDNQIIIWSLSNRLRLLDDSGN